MTIEYIRYSIPPEDGEAFIEAYSRAAAGLDASPHCLAYELSHCEEEPGQFILRIEWTSTEEHLNGFRKGADFPAFFTAIRPFFNNIREMRHYQLTRVGSRK